MTLVDIAVAALSTRSDSTRIFGSLGAIDASIPTISSDLDVRSCCGVLDRPSPSKPFSDVTVDSENPIGLVVKAAVSNRKKRSYIVR